MRISDAQIKEIAANPRLLDVFLYMTGKRNMLERLADIQERGTHDIFQAASGYLIAPKNSGVQITLPSVPWYRRWWNAIFAQQPSAVTIGKPASPTIPSHWQPFESEDQCNLDQDFDLIFYLFSDCKMPGTKPLNFMLGSRSQAANPDSGYLSIAADKVEKIAAAVEAVSEETLRKRYNNKERLTALGYDHAYEWEGIEYDEAVGNMISNMRKFLHRVWEKGDGMLIQLT